MYLSILKDTKTILNNVLSNKLVFICTYILIEILYFS